MEDVVVKFVIMGKLDFKSFVQSVIVDFVCIQVCVVILGLVQMGLSMVGSMFGLFVGDVGGFVVGIVVVSGGMMMVFGDMFYGGSMLVFSYGGGLFVDGVCVVGGLVFVGGLYFVGEQGLEFFRFSGLGLIVLNYVLGGGGVVVNVIGVLSQFEVQQFIDQDGCIQIDLIFKEVDRWIDDRLQCVMLQGGVLFGCCN